MNGGMLRNFVFFFVGDLCRGLQRPKFSGDFGRMGPICYCSGANLGHTSLTPPPGCDVTAPPPASPSAAAGRPLPAPGAPILQTECPSFLHTLPTELRVTLECSGTLLGNLVFAMHACNTHVDLWLHAVDCVSVAVAILLVVRAASVDVVRSTRAGKINDSLASSFGVLVTSFSSFGSSFPRFLFWFPCVLVASVPSTTQEN